MAEKIFCAWVLLLAISFTHNAQVYAFFLDSADNATFPGGVPVGVKQGGVSFADVNNDGRLDFAMCGNNGVIFTFSLYVQNDVGEFINATDTQSFPSGVPPGVNQASMAFADVDGDGRQDFLLTGNTGTGPITRLYVQSMNGVFVDATNSTTFPGGLPPPVRRSSVAFADVNDDDRPDFVMTGIDDSSQIITRLYVQTATGVFTDATNTSFVDGPPPGIQRGVAAFGDVNGDLLPDLLLAGQQRGGAAITLLYVQNSPGLFQNATNATVFPSGVPPGVFQSSVAFGDVNGDDLVDFMLTGSQNPGLVTLLYVQEAGLVFQNSTSAETFPGGIPDVFRGTVALPDVDGNGKLDLMLTGDDGSNLFDLLYIQTDANQFLNTTSAQSFPEGVPPGLRFSAIAFGDATGNGLLDMLLVGETGSLGSQDVRFRFFTNGCPSGSYLNDTSCAECSGFVFGGQTICVICAANEVINTGSEACEACPSGQVPNTQQTACIDPTATTTSNADSESAGSIVYGLFDWIDTFELQQRMVW